jgi:hypothetical protein
MRPVTPKTARARVLTQSTARVKNFFTPSKKVCSRG